MKFGTVNNVIVVVVDALRTDRVGCFNGTRKLTPTIDSLAEEGIAYDNAFSCTNATDPSITSIHTGRLPRETVYHHAHIVTDKEKRRVEASQWLPEILRDSGISPIAAGRAMGRWHTRGFDLYPDADPATETSLRERLSVGIYNISPTLQRLAASLFHYTGPLRAVVPDCDAESSSKSETSETSETALLDAIDSSGSPFYGFFHMMDTHAWYDADPSSIEKMLRRHEYPNRKLSTFFDEHSENTVISKILEPNATERDYEVGLSRLLARYDATVKKADDKIARLVDGLKSRGHWDDTALIVCSDHGESLTEHGIYFDHHGLYDTNISVPLVLRLPGLAPRRVETPVQLHDLFPTICELFDVENYAQTDAQSLLTPLRSSEDTRDAVFVEEAHAQRRVALRTDDWKYIEHRDDEAIANIPNQGDSFRCGYCKTVHGGERELYDLRTDPDELENVADANPDTAAELADRLADIEATLTPVTEESDTCPVEYNDEDAVLERLDDLGYR